LKKKKARPGSISSRATMINLAQQKVYYNEKLGLIISHVITWMRIYSADNLRSTHPKLGEAQAEFIPNWNILYEQLWSQQKHQNSMLFGAQHRIESTLKVSFRQHKCAI
jgi:hypothetical protein